MSEDSTEYIQPVISDPSKDKPLTLPTEAPKESASGLPQAVPPDQYERTRELRMTPRRNFLAQAVFGLAAMIGGRKAGEAAVGVAKQAANNLIEADNKRFKEERPGGPQDMRIVDPNIQPKK